MQDFDLETKLHRRLVLWGTSMRDHLLSDCADTFLRTDRYGKDSGGIHGRSLDIQRGTLNF
jgi:hypothetical protein